MRLTGKTILVTAAGQGIGRASAIACRDEGARVIATDLNGDLLSGLEGIETSVLDVTDPVAVREMAARAGRLDGLFNCAGYVHHGTILDITDESWDFSFALNVTAMMRLARACLPGMLDRAAETGTASILNMASMASSVKGFVNRTAYGASKAAVIGLTKTVALETATDGITVNCISPGYVWTPLVESQIPDTMKARNMTKEQVINDVLLTAQPTKEFVTVEQVAALAIFLCTDAAKSITGTTLPMDGGWTAH